MNVASWAQRLHRLTSGNGLRAQLLRGGVGSVAVKVSGMSLSLGLAIVLARTLGPEGYGIYAYVLALVSLLSIPAQFGLPALVVRETAKAQVNKHWGLLRGVWRWATLAACVLSVSLALVGGAVAWIFAERFTELQLTTFAWGLMLVPLLALGNLRGAALRGLRCVVQGQLPETVLRPALLLLLLAFVLLLWPAEGLTSAQAMALHAGAAAAAFSIGAWLLLRARPGELRDVKRVEYRTGPWLHSALPLAFIAGMQLINQQTDVLMLGIFGTAEDVGIYRVALQGATLVSFGLTAIGMVTWPYYARLHEKRDMAAFQQVATLSARAMLALALPVAAVFILVGEWLLEFVFGSAYTSAYYPLVILACANVIHAGFGTVGPLLNMTGHERITARGIAIAAGCNVALNAVLIPPFGMVGAAAATSLTLVIWNFILWMSVRRVLRIDSSALGLVF
jgi:O-antigen/teichoic acid export membrane protein